MKRFKRIMLFGMIAALSCIVTACKTSEQEIIWPEQEEIPSEQESGQLGQELTQPEAEGHMADALDGQILEQSFETELDGFGKVVFAPFEPVSYPSENPDYGTTMFGDVSFMLLSASDGEKVYEFPGETEDNILEVFNKFTQVLSVTFRDYNDDV
ncbi:MAG: hypothetical protein K2N82_09710, partial [Lachnospiraceae bacterium]|nr:hypothetical protein [Lachnospiraceae bacterium]